MIRSFIIELLFLVTLCFGRVQVALCQKEVTMSNLNLVATHTGKVIFDVAAADNRGYDGFVTAKKNSQEALQVVVKQNIRKANIAADKAGKAAARARRVFVGSLTAVKARLAAKVRNSKAANELSAKASKVSLKRKSFKKVLVAYKAARTNLDVAIKAKAQFFENWSYSALMSNKIPFDAHIIFFEGELKTAKTNLDKAREEYNSKLTTGNVPPVAKSNNNKGAMGKDEPMINRSPIVEFVPVFKDIEDDFNFCQSFKSNHQPHTWDRIATVDSGNGKMEVVQVTYDHFVKEVIAKTHAHSNLGKALASLKRRMGHLPMATLTMLPGSDGAPKIIVKTNGRDNIGLVPFADAFGLDALTDEDVILLEANGVDQASIDAVALSYVDKGYRPVGARMMIRCFDQAGNETIGADYIRAIDMLLGTLVDVRSYFSLGSAPALKTFKVEDSGITTPREDGDDKPVLFFAGPAKDIFERLDGTEGGLPISEGAMHEIFGSKKPGQPRLILRLNDKKAVLFKGNYAVMSARAFEDDTAPGGYVFLSRAHFGESDAEKAAWREGFDFMYLEEDTPKGRFKAEVQFDTFQKLDVQGKLSGWLIAEASDSQGSSLVSYQVLALLAKAQGLDDLAEKIDSLVSKAVATSVAMVEADLEKLDLNSIFVNDFGLMKEWVAGNAPNSARQSRKNHLGFGAKMSTGYIHMASLFAKGNIVVGNEFGLTPGQIKRDLKTKKLPLFEDVCGGKNPILDHNQVFLGKAFRLRAITFLRDLLEMNHPLSNDQSEALNLLFGDQITDTEDRLECLRWILAYAPSLTRGSILMNAEDVADLAGDDDGDMLWFSFRCENTLAVFREVKAQAVGNQNYSIENNKGAQLPSEVGAKDFVDMLTAKGDELREMVLFIMAPNKGQGPVGFLANLCTVLITFFKKVDNGNGGLKFENVWVERLQAALNLMQQTSIDLQKRIYATICLLRWTLADLRKEKTGSKGLVPGFNFPALGYDFNSDNFDVNSFSKEDYKKALKKVDMPMIPHHYTGELMSVCTELDSQYNIGVIGSWLIWECLSLIVTDKPAAWCDDMHEEAKGGLNPYNIVGDIIEKGLSTALFGTDQIPAALMEKYLLAESLYVEKASQLYSWKSQSKNRAFDVKAPPALELNHRLALKEKAKYVPSEAPNFNVGEIISAVEKEFAVYSLTESKLKFFFDNVLHYFQVEAALANNLKATSQKYQTAEERSGVEALNLLLDALDNFKKADSAVFHKLALGVSDSINPRVAIDNKDAKIGLVSMMLAWHQRELAAWAFDEMANQIYALQEFDAQDGRKYSKTKAWENEISKWNLKHPAKLAKSAVKGKRSKLRKDLLFLERCESNLLLAVVNPERYEKEKAKATWFIDEGIPALVKAKERQTIVSSKRDVLRNVTDAVKDWHNYRNDWSDDQVTMEILTATFANGDSLWFEPIKEKLQALASKKESLVEIKRIKLELRKALSDDAKKAIKAQLHNARKGNKASHLLDALEAENYKAPQLVDMFCDPKQNPFAKEFVVGLRQNSGPIVNIERAWRRATSEERQVIQAWTQELGDWINYQKKDRETGMKSNHSRLYAYSRVEWELGQKATAFYTRSLLESGLSIYKLTPIPGRRSQTWRYFDAFVYNYQPLNDWQIANGIGHLISVAAPLAGKDSDDSRWARFNSVKFLSEEVEAYDGYDLNLLNSFDRDSVEKDLEGMKEEIARIENLASNGLMARWGHLWFPVTWGFVKRAYAGQLTQKKLAGRAYIALKLLGLHNPKYHEQPEYVGGPNGIMLPNVTKELKPLSSNGRHMPWARSFIPRDSSRTKARILKQLGATDFDDSVDLKPFSWDGDCQKTFAEWLDFIQGVAGEGLGDISGLVMSGLWFQGHTGRLSVMDPSSDIYNKEVSDKCRKKLLATPSYEARLHIEDLSRGDWIKPHYPKMTKDATDAFYTVIRKLTKAK